jgi:flavin-dependent dehydrogenase
MNNNIVVLGGGTAGWLSALFFKKVHPQSKVTVVESEEIGIIGVGEGTTPYFTDMLTFLDISILDILKASNITFKLGTKFDGWCNKPFFHTFNLNNHCNNNTALIKYFLKKQNKDIFKTLNALVPIVEQAKIQEIRNNLPLDDFAVHFDARMMCKTLADIALSRGIERVQGTVSDVKIENEKVVSLVLSNGHEVRGSFFVDCSGFKRIIANKFNIKFEVFKDLLANTAIPCPIKKLFFEPYTTAKTLDYGWTWKIPTLSRTGTGYIFSRDYVDVDTAKEEFGQYLKTLTDEEVNLDRVIFFEPGMLEKLNFSNVLVVGLASHFLEPIEATSLAITVMTLFEFIKRAEDFNVKMSQRINQIRDFVVLHYLTNKTQNNFWLDANKKAKENNLIQKLLSSKILDFDLFKDNDNYFGFLNHFVFLQNLNAIDPETDIMTKKYNTDFSYIELLKYKMWRYSHVKNAVDYKTYYEQFL